MNKEGYTWEDLDKAWWEGFDNAKNKMEKRIAELEEKISVLLSCKNCPENKGGLICQKEYEDKCLAQKIEYIKELQEEVAELKAQLESERDLPAIAYMQGAEKQKKKDEEELKKWKDEWQEQVQKATDEGYERTLQTVQLTKAKELLKGWLGDFYSPKAFYQQRAELVEQSEQFLKENSTYERIQKAKYNYTN